MPKPVNKSELIQAANANFQQLVHLIESIPIAEQNKEFPEGTLNRNIRDVLAHLHHWHMLFLGWYKIGIEGEQPKIPAKGYTWKTTKALNQAIQQQYKNEELPTIKNKLNISFTEVLQLIEKHTNEELFEKKRYKWTGSTSLGAYLISNTSSHYHWAYKLIKRSVLN